MKRVIMMSTLNLPAFKVDQKDRSMLLVPKCNDKFLSSGLFHVYYAIMLIKDC
jgi:hypothetical protein